MERTTFNLLFYIRRTKLNKTGEAPVFMRLTIDGSRAEASVKHTIKPNNWSTAKGRAENTSKEGKSLNVCLSFFSCPQSLPASKSFPMSQLFA